MIRVVFFDKQRETYHSEGGAIMVTTDYVKHNGRYTKFWFVHLEDGSTKSFKCKDYEIYRVEI